MKELISKIISGGQCGSDQGALFAAHACGLVTKGWVPKGWKTEAGPAPWLVEYGLKEHSSPNYNDRTWSNVADSHAVIWFGDETSRGGRCTLAACEHCGVPYFLVRDEHTPQDVYARLKAFAPATTGYHLMIAGNRESSSPGIGSRVEQFMTAVFKLCQEIQNAKTG